MSQAGGYEKSDVNLKKVVIIGISITLFLVVAFIFLNEYFIYEREAIVQEQVLSQPSVKLEDLRAVEDSLLTSYELIDTTKQIYRIPIDRAIELMAAESAASKK